LFPGHEIFPAARSDHLEPGGEFVRLSLKVVQVYLGLDRPRVWGAVLEPDLEILSFSPLTEKPAMQRLEERLGNPMFFAETKRFPAGIAEAGVGPTFIGAIRLLHNVDLAAMAGSELSGASTDLRVQRQFFQPVVLERERFRRIDDFFYRGVALAVD
jgi:hypothetical protein